MKKRLTLFLQKYQRLSDLVILVGWSSEIYGLTLGIPSELAWVLRHLKKSISTSNHSLYKLSDARTQCLQVYSIQYNKKSLSISTTFNLYQVNIWIINEITKIFLWVLTDNTFFRNT